MKARFSAVSKKKKLISFTARRGLSVSAFQNLNSVHCSQRRFAEFNQVCFCPCPRLGGPSASSASSMAVFKEQASDISKLQNRTSAHAPRILLVSRNASICGLKRDLSGVGMEGPCPRGGADRASTLAVHFQFEDSRAGVRFLSLPTYPMTTHFIG